MPIPESWLPALNGETTQPYYQQLYRFVGEERRKYKIYPPGEDVFNALRYTPLEQVRVVIIGQDPYHDENQAHGLAFSVRPGVTLPPSLINIYKELQTDLQFRIPNHGCLIPWAEQGVLLLNAVLTVRAHQANSHQGKGWESFTDAVLRAVNAKTSRVVFLLWGSYAQRKAEWIDANRHTVLKAPHPSPLSAARGFFGCRHFSKANAALQSAGLPLINWQLPDM
ncbi:MAG TPA: uracil-DNA glycosylase [Anaerolineaceae bacterium]|nr:uracil-DNA glycosylase [Anaerolineaceae bacterium]HQH87149.1 uracil-DNA glycosylase [Anaerolineaceae bacterium]